MLGCLGVATPVKQQLACPGLMHVSFQKHEHYRLFAHGYSAGPSDALFKLQTLMIQHRSVRGSTTLSLRLHHVQYLTCIHCRDL